jgi:flagellar L-ring protein precursor FlgH
MQTSFLAVQVPEPRRFAQNDLVTIVISERIEDSADSSLDTEKKSDWKGEIKDFPSIDLRQLLQAQLKGTPLANPPKVDVGLEKSFEGDGKHRNRNTLTARMTARIIDVKPNGLLAVEARKHLRIDREELTIVLTGVLRPEDVNADNTVLSSQLADVRIAKELKGELRDVKDRGLIGKFFAILLDF